MPPPPLTNLNPGNHRFKGKARGRAAPATPGGGGGGGGGGDVSGTTGGAGSIAITDHEEKQLSLSSRFVPRKKHGRDAQGYKY